MYNDELTAVMWALNSAVECHPHTVEVVGSNPTAPTIFSPFIPKSQPAISWFHEKAIEAIESLIASRNPFADERLSPGYLRPPQTAYAHLEDLWSIWPVRPLAYKSVLVANTEIPVFRYCCRSWENALTLAGEEWRSRV